MDAVALAFVIKPASVSQLAALHVTAGVLHITYNRMPKEQFTTVTV